MSTAQQTFDFDHNLPLARSADPDGSVAAVVRHTRSGRLASSREQVAVALAAQAEPVTSKELAQRSGLDRHETARRLADLEKLGRARKCGTRAGSKESLWLSLAPSP